MKIIGFRSKQELEVAWDNSGSTVPGLILADSSLTPVAFNYEGAAILAFPDKPKKDGVNSLRIPKEIVDEIGRQESKGSLAALLPVQVGRRQYVCHVFLINYPRQDQPQPLYALLLQRRSSTGEAVQRIAEKYKLTDREREALVGVSMGLSGKELAERMRISPNTVKTYLRLVMVKLGVNSRASVVAKILEQSYALNDGLAFEAMRGTIAPETKVLRAAAVAASGSKSRTQG